MPIYEYICEQDGTVLELLRPMADADKPVADPAGQGRAFRRTHSTFATGGAAGNGSSSVSPMDRQGGCCPCGKRVGGCGGQG